MTDEPKPSPLEKLLAGAMGGPATVARAERVVHDPVNDRADVALAASLDNDWPSPETARHEPHRVAVKLPPQLDFLGPMVQHPALTTNRGRPLDLSLQGGISRQTFLGGGVEMLPTGAMFGTARAAADPVSGNIANGPGWTFTCADTDLATWDMRGQV